MKADFIGTCCLDQIYIVPNFPFENTKLRASKNHHQAGGFATNAAKTYALLGGDATLHSCIGQSSFAKDVYDDLNFENLTIKDYSDREFQLHSSAIIINQENGSRTIVSSSKDNMEDSFSNNVVLTGDVLFIDGFFIESAVRAVKDAKAKNIPVIFDADKWRDDRYLEFISDIDFIIASEEFFPPDCHTEKDVIEFFNQKNIKHFAITKGARDIIAYNNCDMKLIPVPQIDCIDSLGAGDVFHGAFCFYILTENFFTALEKSAKIASFFCTDFGFQALQKLDDTAIFGA